ncbi:MAG: MoxR family ATPase [Pirellulaceae bacterium]|nr:MoxR family ATPase [Pirellulaceae bacterium]
MIQATLPNERLPQLLGSLRGSLGQVIKGKGEVIECLVAALIAGGSILLEDVPGVGKTTLAKALAASVDLEFRRVQCTPDLLPADIFGFSVYNPQDGTFQFRAGPIFCNVLLLDEINRASPRTQSALLEAMAECQVTIEGTHHELPPPFLVVATQNPAGYRGTFPLPESQLDRFLFTMSLGYPDAESELEMLYDQIEEHPVVRVASVWNKDDVLACQRAARRVHVERSVAGYLLSLVRRTRDDARLRLGCSPRGSLALFRASQAMALMAGRQFVLPDDVRKAAPLVLQHRIVAARTSEASVLVQRDIVASILADLKVPL